MASGRDISLSHASKDQHGGPDQLPQPLYQLKRRFETGQEVKAYAKFELSRQRYSQLRSRIEQSFRRFDYEPERERLIIRMPSAVHDIFSASLANEVTNQLRSVGKTDPSTAHFVSQIVSGASSEIDLNGSNPGGSGPQLSRQPDQQFQHKKAVFPGVVVEISYAQDGKHLGKLAQSYILESNGGIRAVVGIDINSRGSQPSTVSLWRASLSSPAGKPRETVLKMDPILDAVVCLLESSTLENVTDPEQPFRSHKGAPINRDKAIRLTLHDFALDQLSRTCKPLPIHVGFDKLCQFIDEAEEMQKVRKRKDSEAVELTPPTKKVKLFPSSPPQVLSSSSSSDDTAMEERALRQDPSFEPPNTKRKA